MMSKGLIPILLVVLVLLYVEAAKPTRGPKPPPRRTQTPPRATQAPPRGTQAPPRRTQAPPRRTQAPTRSTRPPPTRPSSPAGSDGGRFSDSDTSSDSRPYSRNPYGSKAVPADFNSIKTLLAQERANSKLYNTVWSRAETTYAKKKQDHPDYFTSSTPDECYIAVIAYTLGTPVKVDGKLVKLYQDFNHRFRALTDEASWNNFPYKSFYYLIVKAVPGIKNDPNPRSDAFRGIENWHLPRAPKVGDSFYFDYFASCTTDRSVAERFLRGSGTLIEIDGGAQTAIGIDKYSPFDENEILVFPSNKFKVTKFEKRGNIDVLVIQKV